jgi:hypothetical protein
MRQQARSWVLIVALGTMQAIAGARHDTSSRSSTPIWRRILIALGKTTFLLVKRATGNIRIARPKICVQCRDRTKASMKNLEIVNKVK